MARHALLGRACAAGDARLRSEYVIATDPALAVAGRLFTRVETLEARIFQAAFNLPESEHVAIARRLLDSGLTLRIAGRYRLEAISDARCRPSASRLPTRVSAARNIARGWTIEPMQGILAEALAIAAPNRGDGKVADYIPALARVDPAKLGIAFAGADGDRPGAGDGDEPFSIQSISKVFTLALALERVGGALWKQVGREPSGARSIRSSSSRARRASRAIR